jgi:hypothetical protein
VGVVVKAHAFEATGIDEGSRVGEHGLAKGAVGRKGYATKVSQECAVSFVVPDHVAKCACLSVERDIIDAGLVAID